MYFDNLTIAGILAAALYAFLPLLFGRETLHVEEDTDDDRSHPGVAAGPTGEAGCGQPHPCSP
jgi:hypothetical protein